MTSETPQFADIHFRISDHHLVADLKADKLRQQLTETQISERLIEDGFTMHQLSAEMIEQLQTASESNKTQTVKLHEHRNASYDIVLENDQVQAFVEFTPAVHGKSLDKQVIIDELLKLGVKQDHINLTNIEKMLTEDVESKSLVAEGISAIPGEDACFEVLFETEQAKGLKQNFIGDVNHYDSHEYITVAEGSPVLRKIPATAGTKGKTVLGEDLVPEPGQDCDFKLNDSVTIAPDDHNLLLAAITGHPIFKDDEVTIDETLSLKDASLETGNIQFDGSVQITGDVKPNVTVEATGDIFVEGLVENANLIAGNTITIKSGVISSRLYEDDAEKTADNFKPGCRLVAEKDLYLKYCNSVHAVAGGTIFIENYSLHSILDAKDAIIAGYNNGQGILLGGTNQAEEYIEANVVGSDAYVATQLLCAQSNELMRAIRKNKTRIGRMKEELGMLSNVLNDIKQLGTPETVSPMQLKKAKKIFREIQENKHELTAQRKAIKVMQQQLHDKHNYRIKINKTCYPNVRIRINVAEITNSKIREACTFDLDDTEIIIN